MSEEFSLKSYLAKPDDTDFNLKDYLAKPSAVEEDVSDEARALERAREVAAKMTGRWARRPAENKPPREGERMAEAIALSGVNTASFGMLNRAAGVANVLQGGDYSEGVDKASAREQELRSQYPWLTTGADVGGGLLSGGLLARGGMTLAREGQAFLPRLGVGVAEGTGYGAVGGAGSTYSGNLEDYATNALTGGAMGGIIGGAAVPVVQGLQWAGGKLAAPFRRYRPDEDVAAEQVAKAVRDSGRNIDTIASDVRDAHAAGQVDYTPADAIGEAGQRKLAVVLKQEGPARQAGKEFLENRNFDYPDRMGGELNQAMGVEGTAKQAEARLIDTAKTNSAPYYDEAMAHGPVWNNTIEEGLNNPIMKEGLKRGVALQEIDNSMTGKPFRPEDASITSFDAAGDPVITGVPNMRTLQTAKVGLDEMIEESFKDGRPTSRTRSLTGFKQRLLAEIDAINPAYKEARRQYAGPMSVREAVKEGSEAVAPSQRAADTIDNFRAYGSDAERQGHRIGWVDRIASQLEANGLIPNILRARSKKGAAEIAEQSLYNGPQQPGQPSQIRRFLNREEEMRDTANRALGGSPTFENTADAAGTPGLVRDAANVTKAALSGRWSDALTHGYERTSQLLRGESESQREAITRMLLRTNKGIDSHGTGLNREMTDLVDRIKEVEAKRAKHLLYGQIGASMATRGATPGATRVYIYGDGRN